MKIRKEGNPLEKKRPYPQLNHTITDLQERQKIVNEIVNAVPASKLTTFYLEELSNYLTETADMKKNKLILTDNRMVTVDKRQTSFEGFAEALENQESGIYSFIAEQDKNRILTPKVQITQQDVQDIPPLAALRQEIAKLQNLQAKSSGRKRALLTRHLIQMRKDQYVIKNSYKPAVTTTKVTKYFNKKLNLDENIVINSKGEPVSDGLISLLNPSHVSALLCNYSNIKKELGGNTNSDLHYIIEELEVLIKQTLFNDNKIFFDLVQLKFKDKTGKEISAQLLKKYGVRYSDQHISVLWRRRIPKIIADKAKENWLIWHYTYEEKGQWKKCSRCKEIKLAHPYFFTKNKTSKDGWYSMCKCCRNKKNKKG